MKPAPFTYHAPCTIAQAVDLLAELAPRGGRVLAGGQSLVPAMAFRLARPEHLIDINGITALDSRRLADGTLAIGALTRHAAFHQPHPAHGALGRLLASVATHIAHYPIRTRGTLCGSLAHADPASEWCLVAATLDAELHAVSARGGRRLRGETFFRGLMATALSPDELLVEARLPLLPEGTRCGFWEFSRRAGDYALAMALVTYRLDGGRLRGVRVGLGAVEEKPRRVTAAEAALEGQVLSPATFTAAAEAARDAVAPLDDPQTSAAYRRDLAGTAVLRALETAA